MSKESLQQQKSRSSSMCLRQKLCHLCTCLCPQTPEKIIKMYLRSEIHSSIYIKDARIVLSNKLFCPKVEEQMKLTGNQIRYLLTIKKINDSKHVIKSVDVANELNYSRASVHKMLVTLR